MTIWVIDVVATLLPILVSVAFITLLERKILGISQLRKGPNKVSVAGILQPIADAVKLFLKESVFINKSNKMMFFVSPGLSMFLMSLLVTCFPTEFKLSGYHWSGVLIIFILSLGVYPLFLQGWSSNSKYSLLGSIRGVAQTISYEISLAIFLFTIYMFCSLFSIHSIFYNTPLNPLVALPLYTLLFISSVAETNRTPFDFAEGESELVSGFNTEFGGGLFALIFMAEYGMIIFFSYFLAMLITSNFLFSLSTLSIGQFLIFTWIWLRSTYPRYRYDKLLNLAWKSFLPWGLTLLTFFYTFYLI